MAGNTIYMQPGSKYIDIHDNEVVNLNIDKGSVSIDKTPLEAPQDNTSKDACKEMAEELLALAENGDWVEGITAEDIKGMLTAVLGMGEEKLTDNQTEMSAILWDMLEQGRGDRVRVTWQNLVGYLLDKKLLREKSAPELNKDFFGDKKGSDNINKGKYGRLEEVTPLLDAFVPKLPKK